MRFDVEPGDPKFGMLFPCICTTERQQEKRSRELNSLSNMESLRHLTFESFDSTQRGAETAFRISREYARTTDGWLVLHGGVGVGKTHLAAAVANAYASRNIQATVYFRVVPDLLDQLRATFDPETGVAYSAHAALALAVELRPDVAFLEMNLLDMDSNELAQLLRERAQLSHLRLIAMTSSRRHDGRDIARNAGFERYLLKPVAAADLSKLLAAQLGRSAPES